MSQELERRYEIARAIFRLNQLQQRHSKFIGTAYRSELTLLETYTLMEVGRDTTLSIAELVTLLISQRSTVTRAISRLIRERYIRRLQDRDDRRAARFELLQRGIDFLSAVDKENREFTDRFLPHLSLRDLEVMKLAQRLLSDVVSAPPVLLRPGEHPFEEGVRRVTRAMGFIGPSLCGSGFSSTVWQILSAINDFSGSLSISELSEMLSMHIATLSQTVARYQQQGWVQRSVSENDARRRVLTLRHKGLAVLLRINQAGADYIVKSFRTQPLEVMEEFLRVFTKHLNPPRLIESKTVRPALVLEELVTEQRREEARGFIIQHRCRLGWLTKLSESLVGSASRTFALLEESRLVAVIECREKRGQYEVLHLCYNEKFETHDLLETCCAKILRILYPEGIGGALLVESRCIAGMATDLLSIEQIDAQWSRVAAPL
jgi:DNA-binding MarR family transcriptional regulator